MDRVVLVDVVDVVVSHPLHVLAHCTKKDPHKSSANNSWHCPNGNVFVLPTHMCGVEVVLVLVDVLVVVVVDVDAVDVDDVVEVDDEDVDEVVLDDVLDVVYVVDVVDVVDVVVVVVVSHPRQVLAQCVMLATRLSHKPCNLKASH